MPDEGSEPTAQSAMCLSSEHEDPKVHTYISKVLEMGTGTEVSPQIQKTCVDDPQAFCPQAAFTAPAVLRQSQTMLGLFPVSWPWEPYKWQQYPRYSVSSILSQQGGLSGPGKSCLRLSPTRSPPHILAGMKLGYPQDS